MPRERTFVVVGAALAGVTAAATLRDEGFDGRLVLLGDEPGFPYQRPPLSKTYLRGEVPRDDLNIRPDAWWDEHGSRRRPGTRVQRRRRRSHADTRRRRTPRVRRRLVATGVRNRSLPVPGSDLEGVFQLRTVADADRIRAAAASATHAVVVGMGFIGAEVTASLRTLGLEVTVVEVFETALLKILGLQLGRVLT